MKDTKIKTFYKSSHYIFFCFYFFVLHRPCFYEYDPVFLKNQSILAAILLGCYYPHKVATNELKSTKISVGKWKKKVGFTEELSVLFS